MSSDGRVYRWQSDIGKTTPFTYYNDNDEATTISHHSNVNWLNFNPPYDIKISEIYMYTSWVRPGSTYLIGEIDGVRRLIKSTYYPNQNAYTWSINSDKYVSNIFVVFAGFRGVTSNDIANGRSVLDRLSFECEARIITPVIPTYTLNTPSVNIRY